MGSGEYAAAGVPCNLRPPQKPRACAKKQRAGWPAVLSRLTLIVLRNRQ
jgi:hypothetical protein